QVFIRGVKLVSADPSKSAVCHDASFGLCKRTSLKNQRIARDRGAHRLPINKNSVVREQDGRGIRVVPINVKSCKQRTAINANVVTAAKVVRGHVVKVANQGFLCARRSRTCSQRVRIVVLLNSQFEAGKFSNFLEPYLRGFLLPCVWSIPVEYGSIHTAADYVLNLAVNLRWIRGAITNVNMLAAAASPKQHHTGIDFSMKSGQQLRKRQFTDIANSRTHAGVAVCAGSGSIVDGFFDDRGCGREVNRKLGEERAE